MVVVVQPINEGWALTTSGIPSPCLDVWVARARLSPVLRPIAFPLPGSQCGVGNGRTIAWTAHDDEFSSRDRSLATQNHP